MSGVPKCESARFRLHEEVSIDVSDEFRRLEGLQKSSVECEVVCVTSCPCVSCRTGVPVEISDVVRCRTSRLRDVVDVVDVIR